jgi:hypothetical protein
MHKKKQTSLREEIEKSKRQSQLQAEQEDDDVWD